MAVIHVRTDPDTDRALSELTAEGASVSEAVRAAIHEAAWMRRRERMRQQALELMQDPDDLEEMRRVQEDLEPFRAW